MLPPSSPQSSALSPIPSSVPAVHDALLGWWAGAARDLPWRDTRDPYAILVSEMMLQQTQVDRVAPRWHAWLEQFPTLETLAVAPRAEVLRAWSGLGYNMRAIRLHEMAQQVVREHGGILPADVDALLKLPGVGRYTAAAVLCFAYEQPVPMIDTNLRRVLGRVFMGEHLPPAHRDRAMERLAAEVLPSDRSYAWNQAIMDLGAMLCTVANPACDACPVATWCEARGSIAAWQDERRRQLREARVEYAANGRPRADLHRATRGKVVATLAALPPGASLSLAEIEDRLRAAMPDIHAEGLPDLVARLAGDGLVRLTGDPPRVSLP